MNMLLSFDSIVNARELGGIKCENGVFRPNMFFRSGDLTRASDSDVHRLQLYGIKNIFDFRYEHEIMQTPDAHVDGATLVPLPPLDDLFKNKSYEELLIEVRTDTVQFFRNIYKLLAGTETAICAFKKFINHILDNPGPCLVHCRQGKDRTGVATIILLSALGASYSDIEADYYRSNATSTAIINSLPKNTSEEDKQFFEDLYTVRKEYLSDYFAEAEKIAGSYDKYLTDVLGINKKIRKELGNIFLE